MKENSRIAVIGGGSWATAIAKTLLENADHINWYFRNPAMVEEFKQLEHNPKFLSSVTFDLNKITFFSDLDEIIKASDVLVFVIPSPFLKSHLDPVTADMRSKFVISSIKGIIPEDNLAVAEFFKKEYKIPEKNLGTIGGPCHAEEVAMERLSYLTVASFDLAKAEWFAGKLKSGYMKATATTDVYGTEYGAVIKNIIAIAAGICAGLGYGDNFQAVLVSNATQEMKRFIDAAYPTSRDIDASAYLGDLLVTSYSQFSRNRYFGMMLGKGYSVKYAQMEMQMVAEGYYGVKCVKEINEKYGIEIPIIEAVYNVIYRSISPAIEIRLLTEKIR